MLTRIPAPKHVRDFVKFHSDERSLLVQMKVKKEVAKLEKENVSVKIIRCLLGIHDRSSQKTA